MLADYSILLIGAILVNNFVLVQFLGLCPFMGVSNKLETAMGMSMATTFVLTLASACSNLTYHYLLEPLGLAYLKTISFILYNIHTFLSITIILIMTENNHPCHHHHHHHHHHHRHQLNERFTQWSK